MATKDTKPLSVDAKSTSTSKPKPKKPLRPKVFRVIVRHLPPNMTSETLMQQMQPLPDFVDYYFMQSDKSWLPNSLSRAYFDFLTSADAIDICRRFDGYMFIDGNGDESTALVEWAPSQRASTKQVAKAKSADPNKCSTIDDGVLSAFYIPADDTYKTFVKETLASDELETNADSSQMKTVEQMVADIENRRTLLALNAKSGHTALLQHLATDKSHNRLHKKILARQEAIRRQRVEADKAKRDKKEKRQRKRDEKRRTRERGEPSKEKFEKKPRDVRVKNRPTPQPNQAVQQGAWSHATPSGDVAKDGGGAKNGGKKPTRGGGRPSKPPADKRPAVAPSPAQSSSAAADAPSSSSRPTGVRVFRNTQTGGKPKDGEEVKKTPRVRPPRGDRSSKARPDQQMYQPRVAKPPPKEKPAEKSKKTAEKE